MTNKFTASEVRDLAKRGTDAMQQFIDGRHTLHIPPQHDDADMVIAECLRAMDAFADLLEAREKGVPVGYVHKGYLDRDCLNEELYVTRNRVRDDQLPLYTHPAPADAERLAEALRQIAVTTKGYPNASREGEIAIKALATHSAQAQPPVAQAQSGEG